jgi:PBP1b-binding outer membrane lipoprotein LpoB
MKKLISICVLSLTLYGCSKNNSDKKSDEAQATTSAPDAVAPTLSSSTPADASANIAPCTGNPCKGKIVLVFNESMNTGLTQTLTTEIHDGTS